MTKKGQGSTTAYPISTDAIERIKARLRKSSKLDDVAIQKTMKGIDRAVTLALSPDLAEYPSQAKDELRKLAGAISRLTYLIQRTSDHANFEMWDAIITNHSRDPSLRKFDADGLFGSDLAKLNDQAAFVGAAARAALGRVKVPRGTPPDTRGRLCAFYVATALRANGIEPKTSKTGLYMSILGILSSEFASADTESYINWGEWALTDGVIEESFVNPAYLHPPR